ncbi:MAG: DeoR/GlpR family DNA-binding transcription regulator [Paracoccaceae bacterium]
MTPKQRRSEIAELVGRTGQITVEALADAFEVSLETIRRDLGKLAETGALQKIHGGAKPLRLHAEGSFDERMAEDSSAKARIAEKLVGIVEPGETVFIDTGSTTLICAEELAKIDRLTVITNSVRLAQVMGRASGTKVYLLGGAFSGDNAETAGPMVIEQIARFRADRAILTVAALDADAGAMDSDFDEAQVARAMMAHAHQTVVLAHRSKLGRRAAFQVCRLDDVDMLVCDQSPDSGFRQALEAAQCVLHA